MKAILVYKFFYLKNLVVTEKVLLGYSYSGLSLPWLPWLNKEWTQTAGETMTLAYTSSKTYSITKITKIES
ncbi:hypothetical protein COY95_04755 [Candidatus Woesearchaeota archaeon CG_4_10_14_0_8_um_filter_47_5]|nr:MAG: hypothetical protein COY95_04755 [Candidatus Woesearchaeota archaeon CG_4_10_14_0_8_um_filter_47_5]